MKSSSFLRAKSQEPRASTIKEKNKRYILVRSKRGRYDIECVDKNSWEYWEYSCSNGQPGRWPATGGGLLFIFMIWVIYMLILSLIRLILPGLSRLKELFTPLAAKLKKKLTTFYQKFLRGGFRCFTGAVFTKSAPPGNKE